MDSSKADQVDFVWVYVAEAHADDVWPIRSARANGNRGPVNIPSHRDTKERAVVASRFANDFEITERFRMFVDPLPDEPFEQAYAPWPLRIYCLEGDKLSYISEPQNAEVPIWELAAWLMQFDLNKS